MAAQLERRGARRSRRASTQVFLIVYTWSCAVCGLPWRRENFVAAPATSEQELKRRSMLTQGAVAAWLQARPAWAEEKPADVPPGYLPSGLVATKVGEQVVTPNGLIYEPLEIGTAEEGPRNGPPRKGSTVWAKFTGHINSFDGPVFDASKFRGQRKPVKTDYVEIRLNFEPFVPNGLTEALKLMKVGGKGRFTQPPKLSFNEGKTAFAGDDDSEVKEVPANATLYYEVELMRIIKP